MFSRYINLSGVGLLKRYHCNSNLTHESYCNNINITAFTSKLLSRSHYHGLHHSHPTRFHGKFKWCRAKMSSWLREQSIQIFRACVRQFEFVAAQRVRRSVQIFHLSTRIWDEVALHEFIMSLRHTFARNTSNFLAGAVGFSLYNWEQERIPDEEIFSYSQEIEGLHRLRESTVVCSKCHLRLVIDVNQPGILYCQCPNTKRAASKAREEESEWEPFIERQDMLVWRREEKDANGLYSYKVYGSFDDVSAEDFLQVQIDINYRKEWDATAKELTVIDTDPLYHDSKDSCSDVIYWEMVWPRMFANRDYVYQRRWFYNKETGVVVIVSKGTDHPNAPVRTDTYRVTTYWSYMVIKPYTDFHETGIEFVLTYFDDPGVNIPSAVTAWVAMSGLPDYLCRMREAGKNYKSYKMLRECDDTTPESSITISNQQNQDNNVDVNNEMNNESNNVSSDVTRDSDNCTSQPSHDESQEVLLTQEENEDVSAQEEARGLLDYLFLAKLFV